MLIILLFTFGALFLLLFAFSPVAFRYFGWQWPLGRQFLPQKGGFSSLYSREEKIEEKKIEEKEEQRLPASEFNHLYGGFLPQQFISYIGKNSIKEVKLGDNVQRQFTILVSDIHSFTSLSEDLSPVQSFEFINSYFKSVAPAVSEKGGFIIKYMGDGFMALFAEPQRAIEAAIEIHERLNRYNSQNATAVIGPIHTGIGIHVGSGCLGTVGMPGRMQADIISDAVNLVTRIEALTRTYGCKILISQNVRSLLKKNLPFETRLLDKVQVKGKKNYVQVAEVLSPRIDKKAQLRIKTCSLFDRGFHLLHKEKKYIRAIDVFEEALRIDPQDKAAQMLLDRATYYALKKFEEKWSQTG